MCQAVRAPGVKWTLAAPSRDGAVGGSQTVSDEDGAGEPVGRPGVVSREFLVICTWIPWCALRMLSAGSTFRALRPSSGLFIAFN